MTIEFHPLAMRDLIDAQIYYKDISLNLGRDFRRKADEAVQIIQDSPHLLSSTHLKIPVPPCKSKTFPLSPRV